MASHNKQDQIKDGPHWRIVFRPDDYSSETVPSLSECRSIVSKNRISLRGWDFPHVASDVNQDLHGSSAGNNWIGGWSDFMSHLEYWRFYQSTQFIHLSTIRETREAQWRPKLQSTAKSHHSHLREMNWDAVAGFFDMINFICILSEIVEFSSRLTQASVYEDHLNCTITLNNVEGFVLTPPWDRNCRHLYQATQQNISNTWRLPADTLVGGSEDVALQMCVWFFERLGWQNPNQDAIRRDIADFLGGRMSSGTKTGGWVRE